MKEEKKRRVEKIEMKIGGGREERIQAKEEMKGILSKLRKDNRV